MLVDQDNSSCHEKNEKGAAISRAGGVTHGAGMGAARLLLLRRSSDRLLLRAPDRSEAGRQARTDEEILRTRLPRHRAAPPADDPDLQALKILEERSRRLPDGRFETGLLWREDVNKVPNNRRDALRRLQSLEKKLDRDEDLIRQYEERITNLLASMVHHLYYLHL